MVLKVQTYLKLSTIKCLKNLHERYLQSLDIANGEGPGEFKKENIAAITISEKTNQKHDPRNKDVKHLRKLYQLLCRECTVLSRIDNWHPGERQRRQRKNLKRTECGCCLCMCVR